jgi:hypothetical protein
VQQISRQRKIPSRRTVTFIGKIIPGSTRSSPKDYNKELQALIIKNTKEEKL